MNGLIITKIEFDDLVIGVAKAKVLPQQFTVVLNDAIMLIGTLKQFPQRISIEYPTMLKGNAWAPTGSTFGSRMDNYEWIREVVLKAWKEIDLPYINFEEPEEED